MADLKIIGHGDEAVYVLEYDDEDEFVALAKTLGKTCFHCRSTRIEHTDRESGTPHFCCGKRNDDHSGCPTCYLCEDCGEQASYECEQCGDRYCDGCHEGAHDDDSSDDDEPDDEPDDDASDSEPPEVTEVPEPEVVEARESGADYDERLYDDSDSVERLARQLGAD